MTKAKQNTIVVIAIILAVLLSLLNICAIVYAYDSVSFMLVLSKLSPNTITEAKLYVPDSELIVMVEQKQFPHDYHLLFYYVDKAGQKKSLTQDLSKGFHSPFIEFGPIFRSTECEVTNNQDGSFTVLWHYDSESQQVYTWHFLFPEE